MSAPVQPGATSGEPSPSHSELDRALNRYIELRQERQAQESALGRRRAFIVVLVVAAVVSSVLLSGGLNSSGSGGTSTAVVIAVLAALAGLALVGRAIASRRRD